MPTKTNPSPRISKRSKSTDAVNQPTAILQIGEWDVWLNYSTVDNSARYRILGFFKSHFIGTPTPENLRDSQARLKAKLYELSSSLVTIGSLPGTNHSTSSKKRRRNS